MDVEFRHLRCFAAVAARRSFTQAASDLAITQPQLSRTVRQLERTLRVTLLDRDSRHVELTEVGRRFHRDTERILGDLDRAIAGVVKQAGIRLGFSWLLPDRGRSGPSSGSSGPAAAPFVLPAVMMWWPR